MYRLLSAFFILMCLNFQGFGNQKIDSLLSLSKKQLGHKHLDTILKIAEEFSYGTCGDSIIHYAKISHYEANQLNDSIAILKSSLYWASGLYSKKEYSKSLEKLNLVLNLSDKMAQPKARLQALYLKARNSQALKDYLNAINEFIEAYEFSMSLLKQKNLRHTREYCKGILNQLTYTYWYAGQLNEGITYFTILIDKNPNVSASIKRSYFSNISFLYNRGIDFNKAEFYLLKAAEISNKSNNSNDIYQDQAYLGALYANIGNYPKAIKHYEEAMTIAKQQNSINKTSYILQNLGLCYDSNGDFQKGIDLIFEGIKLFIQKEDKKAIAKAYQHLGRLMIKWHNFKDADKYLKQAKKLHEKTKFKIEESIDYINLAVSKFHQQDKDSALIYLQKLYNTSSFKTNTNTQCLYYLNKAFVHLELEKDPKSAIKAINKASVLVKKTNSATIRTYVQKIKGSYYLSVDSIDKAKIHLSKAWNNHKSLSMLIDKASTAKQLAQVCKQLQQTDSAYFYLQKADSINNRLHLREDVMTLYKKDNEFSVLMTKKEKDILTVENKKLFNRIILIRVFYILFSISLISLLILYMKRRTKKLKHEIHIKVTEQKELKIQSKIHKKTIEKKSLLIQTKENIIAELNEKIRNNNSGSKLDIKFNEIETLLNSKLTTEEDWEQYLQLFTNKNPYFILELKRKFPALSRNEIKLFILIKLNLTTREMAGILMISPSSVNTARYRLRKKLNLNTEQRLEDIINDIVKTAHVD